jgi:hypothetical protein
MTIWSILRPLKIFYGHLVYFVVIWYIFPVLVSCTKKNLATLLPTFFPSCQRHFHTAKLKQINHSKLAEIFSNKFAAKRSLKWPPLWRPAAKCHFNLGKSWLSVKNWFLSERGLFEPGLPDGTYIFKPKIPLWVNVEGLAMEDVGSFMTICSI